MKETLIFRGASGLNTAANPLRLPYDAETGIMDLSAAVNVVIDDSGMVSRRDGFSQVDTQPWHSLFCDGGECVGVRDGALCVIAEDLSVTEIRPGVTGKLSYAQVNDDIFYVSSSCYGLVRGGQHVDWTAASYVGPDTNRQFSGPFPADHIAFHAGRIWLATDGFMVCSEPFGWSWFDLHGALMPMDSRVRMMKPVGDGMYVSTDTKTYWLSGKKPEDFNLSVVDAVPALEYSASVGVLDALEIGLDQPGEVGYWLTGKGPVMGTGTGTVIRLTKDKVIFPETAPVGASLLRGYNLVHTMGVQ